jgi:hypothetical protein
MSRILFSYDKNEESCTFGFLMFLRMKVYPWVNVPSYLPIFTFCLAFFVLGKNFEGSRLPLVYLITTLIIIQNASEIILTSFFICPQPDQTPFKSFDFWASLTYQLANMQSYVSLIWLYSWYHAFQDTKL